MKLLYLLRAQENDSILFTVLLFYWHFLEILWIFIFLVFYNLYSFSFKTHIFSLWILFSCILWSFLNLLSTGYYFSFHLYSILAEHKYFLLFLLSVTRIYPRVPGFMDYWFMMDFCWLSTVNSWLYRSISWFSSFLLWSIGSSMLYLWFLLILASMKSQCSITLALLSFERNRFIFL